MSNVLVGIIGVILFIGLALAGALFLGPRFQESSANAQASAMTASLKQAVDAANLWKLDQGNPRIAQQDTSFLAPGYLKNTLVNPAPAAKGDQTFFWSIYFNDNLWPETVPDVHLATVVQAVVGPEADQKARAICTSIARNAGTEMQTTRDPVTATGCNLINAQYVAFVKL